VPRCCWYSNDVCFLISVNKPVQRVIWLFIAMYDKIVLKSMILPYSLTQGQGHIQCFFWEEKTLIPLIFQGEGASKENLTKCIKNNFICILVTFFQAGHFFFWEGGGFKISIPPPVTIIFLETSIRATVYFFLSVTAKPCKCGHY